MADENKDETTDIVPVEKAPLALGKNGIVMTTLDDIWRFSNYVLRGNMGVKGDTQESIVVKVQMGMEIGVPPMTAIQNIAVINGRPSLWGDLIPGLVEGSGLEESHEIEELGKRNADGSFPNDFGYKYTTTRKGRKAYSTEFLVMDAKLAELWGKAGPWTQHPKRMLMYRARTFCVRDTYPEVFLGMHSAEEMNDFRVVDYEEVDKPTKSDELLDVLATNVLPSPHDIVDKGTGELPPDAAKPDKTPPVIAETAQKTTKAAPKAEKTGVSAKTKPVAEPKAETKAEPEIPESQPTAQETMGIPPVSNQSVEKAPAPEAENTAAGVVNDFTGSGEAGNAEKSDPAPPEQPPAGKAPTQKDKLIAEIAELRIKGHYDTFPEDQWKGVVSVLAGKKAIENDFHNLKVDELKHVVASVADPGAVMPALGDAIILAQKTAPPGV